ncbi:hypothetical protein NLJ89_g4136 [Agrocybe chaxingu]|uniref:BRCT domain-containing protein n=1 Tax=Agrocybe chaxingu TaxID=84603 RepID=A0A9W8MUU7_9AGAR|nr:hypothetical protein NLJ89_g4136 [Agrocybe chaxingu]
MQRRRNKSHKASPNDAMLVDLRPYVELLGPQCQASSCREGLDVATRRGGCEYLLGTGYAPTLFKQAVELGAIATPAFTDRVTHLVAEGHGGAKYTCALERKTPILKPSWITESHQIWLRGDDVDVVKSMEEHRLPVLGGLVICTSGITNILRRTQISKLVVAHEGQYVSALERPVKVTHLLCSGDEETDKMRYAEKFNSRGEAKIHLVWEEWFWDSIEFGGRFDEATYQVRRPRPERKTLPEVHTSPPPSSDIASHDETLSSGPSKPSQRVPKNTVEETEEEPAFMNVLPAVTLQLWGGLLERRGYQVTDGEVILSPSKAKEDAERRKLQPHQPSSPVRPQLGLGDSVISSFRRANSFAPATREPGASRNLPFRRANTSAAALGGNAKAGPSKTATPPPQAGESSTTTAKKIFEGTVFRTLGEAKSASVRGAIEDLGGRMTNDPDENVDFIVVRIVSGSKLYREEEDESLRGKYRTECWLEHCIYDERVCTPDENVAFMPLSIPIPVAGAERVVMSISGFDQSESCSLKRLLRALGITQAATFSRRSTHLLCPSGKGLKFDKAREWNIPVINNAWLAALASSGAIPPVGDFLVAGPSDEMDVDKKDVKVKGKAVDKGKGKAKAVDAMDVEPRMNDITNNAPADIRSENHALKPARSLERQPTTIICNSDPPEQPMFGLPTGLGGSSFYVPPSSLLTPQRSLASPPQYRPDPNEPETIDWLREVAGPTTQPSNPEPNPNPSGQRRKATIPNLDEEPVGTDPGRIPSSKSPSPMKAPAPLRHSGSSRLSLSPVKIDHEATKALQESITSLLGKRPSPDGDELPGPATGKGKRARPQRAKAQSRQASSAKIGEPAAPPVAAPRLRTTRSRTTAAVAAAAYHADTALNPFASYPDESIGIPGAETQSQQESMRVMYEDPGMMDEKKRLMSLLKSQTGNLKADDSASVTDILLDCHIALVPFISPGVKVPSGARVHAGFLLAWDSIALEVITVVKKQLSVHEGYAVVTTGHSLGGSLALFAAVTLQQNFKSVPVRTYSYGAPRSGNKIFADYVNATFGKAAYRVVHGNDGVPTMIPTSLGYHHHGVEYWQRESPPSEETTFQCNAEGEDAACSASIPSQGVTVAHTNYFGILVSTPFCL